MSDSRDSGTKRTYHLVPLKYTAISIYIKFTNPCDISKIKTEKLDIENRLCYALFIIIIPRVCCHRLLYSLSKLGTNMV